MGDGVPRVEHPGQGQGGLNGAGELVEHEPPAPRGAGGGGATSYPQGERRVACRLRFSTTSALSRFPDSPAWALSSSGLGRCPNCASDVQRLKISSTCPRARSHSSISSAAKDSGNGGHTGTDPAQRRGAGLRGWPCFDALRRPHRLDPPGLHGAGAETRRHGREEGERLLCRGAKRQRTGIYPDDDPAARGRHMPHAVRRRGPPVARLGAPV